MAEYVLAMEGVEKIVVGRPDAFINHIGKGADGVDFVPERLTELAETFDIFDEKGQRLEVKISGTTVELNPVAGEKPVSGPQLVARANFILGQAQADLDRDLHLAFDAIEAAAAAVARAARDLADGKDAAADVIASAKQLGDAFEQARPLMVLTGFPIIQGDLPVVLAALTEDFGLGGHTGAPPPNQGNDDHMELHRQDRAHK